MNPKCGRPKNLWSLRDCKARCLPVEVRRSCGQDLALLALKVCLIATGTHRTDKNLPLDRWTKARDYAFDLQPEAFTAAFRCVWMTSGQTQVLVPVKELAAWIETNILLELQAAPFDKGDATLRARRESPFSLPIVGRKHADDQQLTEDEQTRLYGFRVAHVFDVSQTEGEPLLWSRILSGKISTGRSERLPRSWTRSEPLAAS